MGSTNFAVEALAPGKYIAQGAIATSTVGASVVPAGWPIVAKFYIHQYDTGALAQGASDWWDVADKIDRACEDIRLLTEDFDPQRWGGGGDRAAFDEKAKQYVHELRIVSLTARAVATILWAAALMLFAWIVYSAYIAVRLLWLAIQVIYQTTMAAMSGPGALLVFAAAQAEANIQAALLFTEMESKEKWLNGVMHGMAAALTGLITYDASGINGGWDTLLKATGSQLPQLVWGSATRVSRDVTARGIGGYKGGAKPWDLPGSGGPLISPFARYPSRIKGGIDAAGGQHTSTAWATPEQSTGGDYSTHFTIPAWPF